MLIILPTLSANINLTTLQQPPFHASRSSCLLIIHRVDILTFERTKASMEIQVFHFVPNHQNVIWVEWNAVRYAPKKVKANYTRLAWYWIRRTRTREDRVCNEEIAFPVQQQGAREVSTGQYCSHAFDFIGKDGCVDLR